MQKDPAMWSRAFAQRLGALLACSASDTGSWEVSLRNEAESLLGELTETFRHLPLRQWNWVEHLTRSLVERRARSALESPPNQRLESLRETRCYAAFLRAAHGHEQPADESDEWSDEDRRDFQRAAWQRLEEEDPYPWPEDEADAQAG